MVTAEALWEALSAVPDPELPSVSVVEMGMVHRLSPDGDAVTVEMIPTFVGCPALELIRRDVAAALAAVEGVRKVTVQFLYDPSWTPDRISPSGRAKLQAFGIASPAPGAAPSLLALMEVPPCPYCGSADTHLENLFGPTACRSICYCSSCRQPFEALKRLG